MADLGTDVNWTPTGIDPTYALVSGRTALAQGLVRRFVTPRGTHPKDKNFGFDIRSWVNKAATARKILEIETFIEGEASKEERIQDVAASVQLDREMLVIELGITDAEGPFKLVLAATGVTVEILRVQ